MQDALDVFWIWLDRRVPRPVIIWVIATLFTMVTGPFGTYTALTLAERMVYWGMLIGIAIVLGRGLRRLVKQWKGDRPRTVDVDSITGVALTILYAPLLWGVNLWVYGADMGAIFLLLEYLFVVALVCMVAGGLQYALDTIQPVTPRMEQTYQTGEARFLQRLDPDLGQDLLRVSADDHYLYVVTGHGEGRVLMRFRDALEELAELEGYQIHRSHWVARKALLRVRRDGRRHLADLTDGKTLPVSNSNLDQLIADGFLS